MFWLSKQHSTACAWALAAACGSSKKRNSGNASCESLWDVQGCSSWDAKRARVMSWTLFLAPAEKTASKTWQLLLSLKRNKRSPVRAIKITGEVQKGEAGSKGRHRQGPVQGACREKQGSSSSLLRTRCDGHKLWFQSFLLCPGNTLPAPAPGLLTSIPSTCVAFKKALVCLWELCHYLHMD